MVSGTKHIDTANLAYLNTHTEIHLIRKTPARVVVNFIAFFFPTSLIIALIYRIQGMPAIASCDGEAAVG